MRVSAQLWNERFRLKPVRAARVSEISEATASSGAAPEDRVNFHIGNPVQDERLDAYLLRAVVGLEPVTRDAAGATVERILVELDAPPEDQPLIEFTRRLIRASAPYTPRGGYQRKSPHPLVQTFSDWLLHQHDPLTYDLGQSSGTREVILGSGGPAEVMRIVLHALSAYLENRPAPVHFFRFANALPESDFPGLRFHTLPDDESAARSELLAQLEADADHPHMLVLGAVPDEETRRTLRHLAIDHPLMLIEVNDAPNQFSMAREAGLTDRVLRIMSPAIFDASLRGLSTMFLAGNAAFLSVIDTMHFQLKGTPSASEMELLAFLLTRRPAQEPVTTPPAAAAFEGLIGHGGAEQVIPALAGRAEARLQTLVERRSEAIGRHVEHLAALAVDVAERAQRRLPLEANDAHAGMDGRAVLEHLCTELWSGQPGSDLIESFLSAFVRHHPEYRRTDCEVVSGSSRTALGILGFHCGIREVIIPDLSWSYEHCFPNVHAVPLRPDFGLDADAIVAAVDRRLAADPAWASSGAVVINNPHNATGRVFDAAEVRSLLRQLLARHVLVIDDLSYQNVAPALVFPQIPTLRQAVDALVADGAVPADAADRVVTIHSMSKTDCLAGARLAVAEIRDAELRERFRRLNSAIRPNLGAMLLTYLFYRRDEDTTRGYWHLRNSIFEERTRALLDARAQLPEERNPFGIDILPPAGSMYPLMTIGDLPAGLSLDWLASGLARQGIGLLPLSTFARTEEGFESGRRTFRLTLGGSDGAEVLHTKTRRVLIDLNRLIAEESAQYNRHRMPLRTWTDAARDFERDLRRHWGDVEKEIRQRSVRLLGDVRGALGREISERDQIAQFADDYLSSRLSAFAGRLSDRGLLLFGARRTARADAGRSLGEMLERELYKDSLDRRRDTFSTRLFDRTVHPTQMYSIRAEQAFDRIITTILRGERIDDTMCTAAASQLIEEYLGRSVAITSEQEGVELVLDLDAHIDAEISAELRAGTGPSTFLSFWGDWDGSNRPSGQGHRLAAAAVMENVNRLSRILSLLRRGDGGVRVDPGLLAALESLPQANRRFAEVLGEITRLTHQLERRYRGVLPIHVTPGAWRRLGMAVHVARDPLTRLWRHNDRLERRMLDLRRQRRDALQHYFALNKQLRKQLHALIPAIRENRGNDRLLTDAAMYRDLLQRMVITPRIHQKMITAQDPFAVDTTVFNIHEINEIAGAYGNPGLVLGLQVSMATKAEALITLDRKMQARREEVLRRAPDADLPPIWLIPLFEEMDSVQGITGYLDKVWDHARQGRRVHQETADRFAEIVSEVFIAGSDLSQQVGQPAGAALYRQAKHALMLWLANHGLADRVRIKMGSGEPMQRQGGYYAAHAGERAFSVTSDAVKRLSTSLPASAITSARYATTPLMGLFTGGDLRTFQSALSEQLRLLSTGERADVLHHVSVAQRTHRGDLVRAAETLTDSRLQKKTRGAQEMERLTLGTRESLYEEFLTSATENFRTILYGREADLVGIHVISYFIARTMPQLRDRPTVRPGGERSADRGQQILEHIARTIPLSRYGSLLRAIAHNQAQTMLLGVNQLTTGVFRALDLFAQREFAEGDAVTLLADRVLPQLPVYEILHTLRLYHDPGLTHVRQMETAFPAGSFAFLALREDNDAIAQYVPLFQQELLRRHGLDVEEFFDENGFVQNLLPAVRPDLAVLFQRDLFNGEMDAMLAPVKGSVPAAWKAEVSRLLGIPGAIRQWRSRAWELLRDPVFQRVQSFVELAGALYTLASARPADASGAALRPLRVPTALTHFFRVSSTEDEMRQFLAAAVEYLSAASEGSVEVPVTIVRAMNDVERLAAIEEQALTPERQDLLRYHLLQIARLTGENG